MPNIKAKSIENINAANLLIEHKMFGASIHCSYYSGFQLSKYVACHHLKISYDTQDKESKGKDSHFYIFNLVNEDLKKKNRFYSNDYSCFFQYLKMLRRKADYSSQITTDKSANEAIKYSNELQKLLIEKYSI